MNPNFIDQEVYRCRQLTGSYPLFPNVPFRTEDLVKSVYAIVKSQSSNLEIKVAPYADSTGNKNVIYIGICLPISYKGSSYSVYSKITFPPNFPMVPPILSILNINENQFEVNKKYFYFVLPDKTYEVKLLSAKFWKQTFNFTALLEEFTQILGTSFPFFKIANPTKNLNVPVIYDPRYNLPSVDFPFDYTDNSGYTVPVDKPYNQPNDVQNKDYYYGGQTGQQNPYIQQVNAQSGTNYPAVTETLENIKQIIESDVMSYEQNLISLIETKEKLEMKEKLAKECEARLQKNVKTLSNDIIKLVSETERQKNKELNEKTVHDLIVMEANDRKIVRTHGEIKGNIDAQQVIEELYLEKEVGEFKDVLKSLNVLWKREFDAKMAYNNSTGQ